MNWEIKFVRSFDEIQSGSFKAHWQKNIEKAEINHVFFHPSLCLGWLDAYRPIRKIEPLFCLAIRGDIQIFFPLVLWKQNWKNAYRKLIIPVGYSDFDYHDPIVSRDLSQEEWHSFYSVLLVYLKSGFNYDSIYLNGIHTAINKEHWSKEKDFAPYCNLEKFSNPEQYLKSLSTSLRGDIRRQIRRIEEQGPLDLQQISNIPEALGELPFFLKYHSEKWPGSYKAPGFHSNLLKYGLGSGTVNFSVLKCGSENISWHLGFMHNKTFYYYMPVINPLYEKYSPGKIHLFKLIEYSIINGYKIFDHLRGDENYKAGWTDSYSKLYAFKMVNNHPVSFSRELLCSIKNSLF
jgi:CelD/BcsL family acetyltransferase involved in cellulose biosynthesis